MADGGPAEPSRYAGVWPSTTRFAAILDSMGNEQAPHGAICVYCGEDKLRASDPPEHPIPYAIGSSMTVGTVCADCNGWASRNVDAPWLSDDWVRMCRADHDVRDPRHPTRPVPHPWRVGFTDEGVRVTADKDWRATLGSRIIEDADRVRIIAPSVDEAERLLDRVRDRVAREGKTIEPIRFERVESRPTMNVSTRIDLGAWLRMAAKVALAMGSHAFPKDWRLSADAERLRWLMRDDDPRAESGEPLGAMPIRITDGDAFRDIVEPPEHLVCFMPRNGDTYVFVVVFGELMFGERIDSSGRPLPRVAWRLDPQRPRVSGETTFDGLMLRVIERLSAQPDLRDDRENPGT